VLGAVAPTPMRLTDAEEMIKGRVIGEVAVSDIVEAVIAGAKPLRMNRYKVDIAGSLLKRTLEKCYCKEVR